MVTKVIYNGLKTDISIKTISEWISKLCYIHITEYCFAIPSKEQVMHAE